MNKKNNRDQQTAVLRQAQERRKQQKREQVFRAIESIQTSGKPLTFPNIAAVAGCSVSYLYKWTELTEYIHDLQQQKNQQLNRIESKEPGPHSLQTLYEVAKRRIGELVAENGELKRQNERLRGHVAEVFELRSECERLRTQLNRLTAPSPDQKVVSLHSIPQDTDSLTPQNISDEISGLIAELGLKIGVRLEREIAKHDPEQVKLAISAFKQYRSQNQINNPGACLLAMIRDEAEPNVPQKVMNVENEEFERWYRQAIERGFCQDVPPQYLPVQSGEILVRVINIQVPSGYELLAWQVAKVKMEEDGKGSSSLI